MSRYLLDFTHESASCNVILRGDTAMVLRVYARDRGRGHATGLMNDVIAWADKNEVELCLRVQSFGEPAQSILSDDQLITFYTKFGFQLLEGTYIATKKPLMIRIKNTPYSEREN